MFIPPAEWDISFSSCLPENCDGSAKTMEADLGVSLIKELEQKGVHVTMCISYTKKIPPFLS